MHHPNSLWLLAAVIVGPSLVSLTGLGCLISIPCKLSRICPRNILEVCTAAQLEYSEIIRSDIVAVAEQFELVVFNYNTGK